MPQPRAFLVEANLEQPEGIRMILRGASIIEDGGALVPSGILTRSAALSLAYALGELAQKLKE